MEITLTGADFSGTGLGSTKWVESFITKAAITDVTKLAALRNLYTQYNAFGFKGKFEVFRLMVGGSATVDALNTIDLESPYLTTFYNDLASNHTTNGWITNRSASGSYGISEYKIKSLSKFHFHGDLVYRDQAWSSPPIGNGILENGVGSISFDYRGDNVTTKIRFDVGVAADAGKVVTVETGELGNKLASSVISGTSIKGYYGGVKILDRTATSVFPSLSGNDKMYEGTLGLGYLADRAANSKYLLFAYGSTDWTATDEANLYTMMATYKTAVGI
jgi:hypothetical protein